MMYCGSNGTGRHDIIRTVIVYERTLCVDLIPPAADYSLVPDKKLPAAPRAMRRNNDGEKMMLPTVRFTICTLGACRLDD